MKILQKSENYDLVFNNDRYLILNKLHNEYIGGVFETKDEKEAISQFNELIKSLENREKSVKEFQKTLK